MGEPTHRHLQTHMCGRIPSAMLTPPAPLSPRARLPPWPRICAPALHSDSPDPGNLCVFACWLCHTTAGSQANTGSANSLDESCFAVLVFHLKRNRVHIFPLAFRLGIRLPVLFCASRNRTVHKGTLRDTTPSGASSMFL